MDDKPKMFTMYRDLDKEVFFVMPSSQCDIFLGVIEDQGGNVQYIMEDEDIEFLEAVGPILI
jgi:hypothetical protein